MEDVSRPEPARGSLDRLRESVREWVGWFGLGRLVGSAVAVVVVCAGAFWLVRSPPPPTEASLPRTTATVSSVPPTLPPPDLGPTTGGAEVPAARLTVHVAGAVSAPGVYDLPADARVHAALSAAGGVTLDADPDALNLAAAVADGSRIYVPVVGEAGAVTLSAPDGTSSSSPQLGPVDVNEATATDLDALPGIGPATAQAIVAERERNGPFLNIDDLERVPGIGPAKLATIRDLVAT